MPIGMADHHRVRAHPKPSQGRHDGVPKSVSITAIKQQRFTRRAIKTGTARTTLKIVNQKPGSHGFAKFQMSSRNRRKKFG